MEQTFEVKKDSEFRFYLSMKDSMPMADEDDEQKASSYGCCLGPNQKPGEPITVEVKDEIGAVVATFEYSLN